MKDTNWQQKHWKTLRQNYRSCPHFERFESFFEDFYLGRQWTNLSEMNQHLIRNIATSLLGIQTEFLDSRAFNLSGQKQDRILELVRKVGAERYLSGPAAKSYIEPERFEAAGIELVWKDYNGYPEYPQRFPPFEHGVSIVDLLFNMGPEAPWYIWGWRQGPLYSRRLNPDS